MSEVPNGTASKQPTPGAGLVGAACAAAQPVVPVPVPSNNSSAMQFFAQDPNDDRDAMQQALDLDELFHDCYFDDLALPEPVTSTSTSPVPSTTATAAAVPAKRTAAEAGLSNPPQDKKPLSSESKGTSSKPAASLTESQKIERRERNREHAKRSRLRKKFLLESLQEQIEGLQGEIQSLKDIIKRELPDKAEALLKDMDGGDNSNDAGPKKGDYTPLPMPSGFGPVKTLMEPDYRLMSALSGSQQNFAISDPSLPDNPIVYVSQGFLDLTGYTLDQVLGRNCRFLQGPGTDQAAVDVIRRGVREGTDTSVCLLNYKADGTPFWNQFFVAALRDAENNVVNFVGVQCEVSKAVVDKHIAEGKTPSLAKK
jgi:PAS domain S-box-containing protein